MTAEPEPSSEPEPASDDSGRRLPRLGAAMRDREAVQPLELFFDLAMVLVFTQCSALMAANPTWTGMGQGMLALAVTWWAWVGYAWLTSVIDPEEGAVRLVMFAAMAALLVVALCLPEAFGDRAVTFAVAYGIVRGTQLALFWIASREHPTLRSSVAGLAISSTIAFGLLFGASFLDGRAQAGLWLAAILIDFGSPAIFGVHGWRLVPAHFAERHGLVIILALGESIVVLGVGSELDLTAGVLTTAVLGVALAAALWWIYFDVVALVTAERLHAATEGAERNALARDSYSYLHLPMVAGIVLAAFGLEETIVHPGDSLDAEHAFALLGGVAVYLLAHVALRLRNAHTWNVQRLVLALVLLALVPMATQMPALAALVGVNVLVWAMIAYETARYDDDRRARLRHGESEPDARSDSDSDT